MRKPTMTRAFIQTIVGALCGVALVSFAMPAAAGSMVFIPLGDADAVFAIDAVRDRVVGRIGDLPAVHGLAETPDGRFLVAGSYAERPAGESMPEKPAGISADAHAKHHGGAAAPDKAAPTVSTVSIVRIADGSVVRRVDVPGAVHHVAVSPDGRTAVVTHPDGGGISAIDLARYVVVAEVATGPTPNYAAFAPDGTRLYVSNAGDDSVSVVDTQTWTALGSMAVGASPEHLVLSEDGTRLYVNNVGDGTVSVLSVSAQKVVQTLSVGEALHGIDLSDDGGTLYVAAMADDRLFAIDLATGAYRGTRLTPAPYHLAVIRGAGKLYVSSAADPIVWVVDQASLTVQWTIPIAGKGHQMVPAPVVLMN
jgi:YVTN family beta-propeller protein